MNQRIKSLNFGDGQLLTPFQRKFLLKNLETDLPELYRQRLQIMLLADEGKSQTEICRTLGCCPATARHWMYIARSGMAHKWQTSPIGRPKVVNEEYLERLKQIIHDDPRNYGYAFRRWTANWLSKHLAQELGVKVSDCHIKRLLKKMGLSTRGKPNQILVNSSPKTHNSQIFITDLQNQSLLDESANIAIHLLKLDTKC